VSKTTNKNNKLIQTSEFVNYFLKGLLLCITDLSVSAENMKCNLMTWKQYNNEMSIHIQM